MIDGPIRYIEFGVGHGYSMRKALSLFNEQESVFYGFDSFVGMHTDWPILDFDHTGKLIEVSGNKGRWNRKGEIPRFLDSRLKIIPGLYQDTYQVWAMQQQLEKPLQTIYWFDTGLYSNYLYLLTAIHPYLNTGDYIYFNEFGESAVTGYQAFCDYTDAYMSAKLWKPIMVSKDYFSMCYEIVKPEEGELPLTRSFFGDVSYR